MTDGFVERLRELKERRKDYGCSGWEGGCIWLYESVRGYDDLRTVLERGSVNDRIFALRTIAPEILDLLDEAERKDLRKALAANVSDERMCDIGYGGSYADDEDTTTVAGAAIFALTEFDKFVTKQQGELKQ
jgi:hypothetical protein